MLAAIYDAKQSIAAREVDEAPPKAGEVLVEVARSGICGSDLHNYFGRWGLPRKAPGHEAVGPILALGEGVSGWRVGDRVAAECFDHCGECPMCRSGQYNHCAKLRFGSGGGHGGMSQRATLYASALFSIEGLTDEQGALAEPLAVGARAASRLGDVRGKEVAVVGVGTIGLMSTASAKALGAGRIVAFARYPHQAEMARRLGADEARLDPPSRTERFPLVIDAAATKESLESSLRLVDHFGRLVVVGCMPVATELNLSPLFTKEAVLTGSTTYSHSEGVRDFGRALEWIRTGVVDPTPIVTHRFPLAEVGEAFRALTTKKTSGAIKVMLLPNG